MSRTTTWLAAGIASALLSGLAGAAEPTETKALSGMSVLGNNEAPKSLVIVPWKTSEIGDGIGIGNLLDGRAQPVDRDVFARELAYYELRSTAGGSHAGAQAQSN